MSLPWTRRRFAASLLSAPVWLNPLALLFKGTPASASDRNFTFAVMSDSHEDHNKPNSVGPPFADAVSTLNYLHGRHPVALTVFNGDFGNWESRQSMRDWEAVMNKNRIPYVPVKGNHELYHKDKHGKIHLHGDGTWHEAQNEYQAWAAKKLDWASRHGKIANFTQGPSGYRNLAYSFDYGNSRFFVLDTYFINNARGKTPSHHTRGWTYSAQTDWLDDRLQRSGKTHNFVFAHTPVWTGHGTPGHNRVASMAALRHKLVKHKKKVRILFGAHEHYYVRWENEGVTEVISSTTGRSRSRWGKSGSLRKYRGHGVKYHEGYVFPTVQVDGDKVTVRAYEFYHKSSGEVRCKVVDTHTVYA